MTSQGDVMAKTAQKKTVGRVTNAATRICPVDGKTMIPTKVVRHGNRSGMYWVCECGEMIPIH